MSKKKNHNTQKPKMVAKQSPKNYVVKKEDETDEVEKIIEDNFEEKELIDLSDLTTEEATSILNSAKEEAKEYLQQVKEKLEAYYNDKKEEANEIVAKAHSEADAFNENLKIQFDQNNKDEYNKIIGEAQGEREKILEGLTEKQKNFNTDLETLNAAKRQLELDKINYKTEISNKIQNQFEKQISDFEELKSKNAELNNNITRLNEKISELEEDIKYYEEKMQNIKNQNAELQEKTQEINSLNKSITIYNEKLKESFKQIQELNLNLAKYGKNPEKAMQDLTALQEEFENYKTQYANYPSLDELEKLRTTNSVNNNLKTKISELQNKVNELEIEKSNLLSDREEIVACRRVIKTLELQRNELAKELDRNIDLYQHTCDKVFATLSSYDNKIFRNVISEHSSNYNLKSLCNDFQGYLANRSEDQLYYDISDIRTFIAGFGSSKITILEGLSGTGKSSLPRGFRDFIGADYDLIEVQSSWKDRNDLLGFYNDFKKQYKETKFLKAMYKATCDPTKIHVIVLDEMNLSRVEYYFADLLSELEKPDTEKREIELISDFQSVSANEEAWPKYIKDGQLPISDNIWFVGTANKDDSTSMITDKVYDRSIVINFNKKQEKIAGVKGANKVVLNNEDFQRMLKKAVKNYDSADKTRADKMIKELDDFMVSSFQITFGNRIRQQLETFIPTYIECGGTVDEAVDAIFSRKVLRKLEGVYSDDIKSELEILKQNIQEEWKYNLPKSIEAISAIVKSL